MKPKKITNTTITYEFKVVNGNRKKFKCLRLYTCKKAVLQNFYNKNGWFKLPNTTKCSMNISVFPCTIITYYFQKMSRMVFQHHHHPNQQTFLVLESFNGYDSDKDPWTWILTLQPMTQGNFLVMSISKFVQTPHFRLVQYMKFKSYNYYWTI